jgi:hypothetical protein
MAQYRMVSLCKIVFKCDWFLKYPNLSFPSGSGLMEPVFNLFSIEYNLYRTWAG